MLDQERVEVHLSTAQLEDVYYVPDWAPIMKFEEGGGDEDPGEGVGHDTEEG